jgi:hypothetical protein
LPCTNKFRDRATAVIVTNSQLLHPIRVMHYARG